MCALGLINDALPQVLSNSPGVCIRPGQACALVTIYQRESDLFALRVRETHEFSGMSKGGGRSMVLRDMVLDDGVHLEQQKKALMVKVVNTCESPLDPSLP